MFKPSKVLAKLQRYGCRIALIFGVHFVTELNDSTSH